MDSTQDYEHERHQRERKQLETLRDTMQCRVSYIEPLIPEVRLRYDPMIYPDLYSPSGFNIMDILIAIRRRPKPTFSIGAIDSSVSLLLCDAASPDLPIVYCTETFQKLAGYPEREILGRNCRFLQYPPSGHADRAGLSTNTEAGLIEVGNHHASADDISADIEPQVMMQNDSARIKITECIGNSAEGQAAFINYRYNGERFWNLLTVIPIENGGRKYFVGLQADLGPVEGFKERIVR